MNTRTRILLAIIGIILLVVIVLYFILDTAFDKVGNSSTQKDYKIVFDTGDTIYLKASVWGLTGDHMQILVSGSPIDKNKYDSSSHYIFYEPTIFYEKNKNTLIIYTSALAKAPVNFNSSINIKQVQLESPSEIERYKNDYLKLGMEKVSVYD